jgi:hypothetical protein
VAGGLEKALVLGGTSRSLSGSNSSAHHSYNTVMPSDLFRNHQTSAAYEQNYYDDEDSRAIAICFQFGRESVQSSQPE